MKIGDLVKYKFLKAGMNDPAGLRTIGIIIAERKMYGHRTKIVYWNDGLTDIEDETTIEVLE